MYFIVLSSEPSVAFSRLSKGSLHPELRTTGLIEPFSNAEISASLRILNRWPVSYCMKNSRDKDIQEVADGCSGRLPCPGLRELICAFLPNYLSWHHAGGLKGALEGEFTSEKLVNTTNQSLLYSFVFGKPISTLLGGHKEDGGDDRQESPELPFPWLGAWRCWQCLWGLWGMAVTTACVSPGEWPCGLGCTIF